MPGPLTDAYAWVVVALFAVGAAFEYRSRTGGGRVDAATTARSVTALAWVAFAGFWLVLTPHFAFTQKSVVEGALSLAAVPACLYAAALLWRGRDTLFVLSRAVAVMGAVYLPFETIPAVTLLGVDLPAPKRVLIRTVTEQTLFVMHQVGFRPELVVGDTGYLNTYQAYAADGQRLLFSIVLACTGLGSMAIFAGLIGAVRAPPGRKLRALAVSVPLIWALNLARTTFIGVVFLDQRMQLFVDPIVRYVGVVDAYKISFFISDRIISQVLAVVALVGITYLVVRQLPELLRVIEDVLYMLTKEEYDLATELDLPREPTETTEPLGGSAERTAD